MKYTVVLDANVLYPAPLRDLLMRLAVTDIFAARWSNRIHDEWIRNLLKNRADLTREQLERTKSLMNTLLFTLQLLSVLHIIQSQDFDRLTHETETSVLHLSMDAIKNNPLDSAVAASKWLGLNLKIEDIAARHEAVSEVHAKSLERRGYNAVMEATLNDNIAQTYSEDLSRAVNWAQRQSRIRA